MTCTDCLEQLQHCHGTLVVHADGRVECLDGDAGCTRLAAAHGWRTSCDDLGMQGCCPSTALAA
jgi:hypothetical protein